MLLQANNNWHYQSIVLGNREFAENGHTPFANKKERCRDTITGWDVDFTVFPEESRLWFFQGRRTAKPGRSVGKKTPAHWRGFIINLDIR